MFINSNTICSLNVCNTVKSMSLAHHIHRVFPVTLDDISNHRPAFYPKTNVLSSYLVIFKSCSRISEPSTYFFISKVLYVFYDTF